MTKRVLLLGLLLISLLVASGGFARQGCPGPNDPCPPTEEPTDPKDPGEQPTDSGPQPTQDNQDRDGDGVPDYVDACPDAPGSGFTNGCPAEAATPVPERAIDFPASASCLMGNNQRANVRQFPSTDDEIVAQLGSGEIARGIFKVSDSQGATWYFTEAGGYIRSDVVSTNGNCRQLPRIQTGAALLHVGSGVISGLQVFPLQRNLNVLSVSSGQAVSPLGEPLGVLGSLTEADIEALAFLVLMQATASAQNDIKAIMQEIKKLNEKEERELDRTFMTQEAQEAIQRGLNQTADVMATLQAATRGMMVLVLRHGDAADCPMFTKWVEYAPEVIEQLELLTPVETTAPCMIEILFSDADVARPNPTGDGVRPNPTGDGLDVRLNRLLIDVTP